jgi:hypothetical protein
MSTSWSRDAESRVSVPFTQVSHLAGREATAPHPHLARREPVAEWGQSGGGNDERDIAVPHQVTVGTSKRRFFYHYLEMILVMLVAMVMLGGVVSLVFGVVGHSNILHYAGLRAFVMTANMTIGMTIWMRFRGHGWANTVEMDGAMVLSDLPSHRSVLGGGSVGRGAARCDARVDASVHVRGHASPLQRIRTGPPEPFNGARCNKQRLNRPIGAGGSLAAWPSSENRGVRCTVLAGRTPGRKATKHEPSAPPAARGPARDRPALDDP